MKLWIIILGLLILVGIGTGIFLAFKRKDLTEQELRTVPTPTPTPTPTPMPAPPKITQADQIAELERLIPLYEQRLSELTARMEKERITLNRARHSRGILSEPITLGSRAQVSDIDLSKKLARINRTTSEISQTQSELELLRVRLKELKERG